MLPAEPEPLRYVLPELVFAVLLSPKPDPDALPLPEPLEPDEPDIPLEPDEPDIPLGTEPLALVEPLPEPVNGGVS